MVILSPVTRLVNRAICQLVNGKWGSRLKNQDCGDLGENRIQCEILLVVSTRSCMGATKISIDHIDHIDSISTIAARPVPIVGSKKIKKRITTHTKLALNPKTQILA